MEVSVSDCPHSAASVRVENTTNLAVRPLRINMASSQAGARGPIARLAWEVLNKVGQTIKKAQTGLTREEEEEEEEEEEGGDMVRGKDGDGGEEHRKQHRYVRVPNN